MRKVAKIVAIIIILMVATALSLSLRKRPEPFMITNGELVFHQLGNEVKAEVGIHGRILITGQRGIAIGQYGFRILEPCPWDQIGP